MVFWHCRIITGALLLSAVLRYGSSVNFSSRNNSEFLYESKLIIRSLEDVLRYLEKRPEIVTSDVILGVLIAKANLLWINNRLKYYFSSDSKMNEYMDQLFRQCRNIIELKNNYYNFSLLKDTLWEGTAENLKFGFLNQYDDEFFLPEFDNCQSIDKYMMKGTEDSDFCINELIHSSCQISEYCWLSEVNGDSHTGYETSHRLLYFQTLIRMKCDEINPKQFSSVRKITKKLCQQMLLEASALFEKPSLSMTKDLFMEQIALCGLEGYEEFAPDIWRRQVRNWQNHKGCFGLKVSFKNCSAAVKKIFAQAFKRVVNNYGAHVLKQVFRTKWLFYLITFSLKHYLF